MPIFMMFGKYSSEALKGISPERTDKAVEVIKKNGGKVISMYAVLGEHDLVLTMPIRLLPNCSFERDFCGVISRSANIVAFRNNYNPLFFKLNVFTLDASKC